MKLLSFFLAGCALASSGVALADAPVQLEPSGRAWLVRDALLTSGVAREGRLAPEVALELQELGGGVLLAGAGCDVVARLGGHVQRVTLGPTGTVAYLELPGTAAPTAEWELRAEGCSATLEGMVVFVGEASAYVGESVASTWTAIRVGTRYAVR